MPTVLVAEDEPAIADAIVQRLRSEGFDARSVGDGLQAVELCRRLRPDLVVLDLMLPGLDGLEVCRRIQTERRVPVVMLTARDDETDLVVGLSVGADDYVTKPFSPRELVARIRAVLRRVADAADGTVLRHHGLELDHAARRVRRDGHDVHLTPIEFDLVAHLLARPGTVFSRERLLADVWGYADGTGPRTVDSHIRAVRRKLGDDVVRTVHGIGYALGLDRTDRTDHTDRTDRTDHTGVGDRPDGPNDVGGADRTDADGTGGPDRTAHLDAGGPVGLPLGADRVDPPGGPDQWVGTNGADHTGGGSRAGGPDQAGRAERSGTDRVERS